MTESEAITSFQYYLALADDNLYFYFTLVTAFLFMSYFIAHKLNTFLSAIVIFLFSVMAFLIMFGQSLISNDLALLYAYILEQKATGNYDLPWFGSNSKTDVFIIDLLGVLGFFGSYIAALLFFFYRKRQGETQ